MKATNRVLRNKHWFAVAFVFLMVGISTGQLFAAPLTQAEKDDLLYMREEEKVARDVYIALYDKWGMTVFNNISKSEQTHMDSIKTLLVRYNLEDPALGPGEFTNQELQAMYDDLVRLGESSPIDALNVGIKIEETDIRDLSQALARTSHRDIARVYQNLRAGSENHLAAFQSNLDNY